MFVILAVLFGAGAAGAQDEVGYRGWGPRVGATIEPDQVHFGAHMDFGHFAEHIRFQPNVEVGVGDDLTLVALNFEGSYRFRENWDVWTPYAGGGLGINFLSFDIEGLEDDTDTDFGLNLMAGIERGISGGDRFFLEAKVGLADSPDMKLTAGWTFF
jgi:opacity protein-like surface antigen